MIDNDMSQTEIRKAIDKLSEAINRSSESSDSLQKWIIAWTIIMAIGVISQAVLIGIQIYSK
jgi:hypothetical protein